MIRKENSLISEWIVFIRVVECSSLTAASQELNKSVSAISKIITRLENALGCQLIHRNAHSFEVTEAGLKTYESAKYIRHQFNTLLAELKAPVQSIQGSIRLIAPTVLCESVLPRWVMNYTARHTGADINLLAREGATFSGSSIGFDDVVIKSGYIDSPDLVHKKIAPVAFGVYASPAYLERISPVFHPADLAECALLKLTHPFFSEKIIFSSLLTGEVVTLEASTRFASNNIGALISTALADEGVCVALPCWVVSGLVESGRLVRLIPEWQLPALPAYLVWRYRRSYTLLFRDFISFLEAEWTSFIEEMTLNDSDSGESGQKILESAGSTFT